MKEYVYILSSSFSGSTLLSIILGSHPRIATVGELQGVNQKFDQRKYVCSCGNKLIECKFWQEVLNCVKSEGLKASLENFGTQFRALGHDPFSILQFKNFRNNLLNTTRNFVYDLIPKYRRHKERIITYNAVFAECICKVLRKDIFLDSSKLAIAVPFLDRLYGDNFKVLYLIRDGRGYLFSNLKRNPRVSVDDVIRRWKNQNLYFLKLISSLPKNKVFLVKYEDLCNRSKKVVEDICHFLKIDFSDECLTFPKTNHHVLGNDMRLTKLNEIKYDDSWKKELTTDQLRKFDKIAGDFNRLLEISK